MKRRLVPARLRGRKQAVLEKRRRTVPVILWVVLPIGLAACSSDTSRPAIEADAGATDTSQVVRLRNHVRVLAGDIGPRSPLQGDGAARAVAYIRSEMARHSQARLHPYRVDSLVATQHNIEADFFNRHGTPVVVVGAHYDTVPATPGADDNASGVAVVLELARQLAAHRATPGRPIRVIFFGTEEPPFFRSRDMGSLHAARAALLSDQDIRLMIAVECVGFVSDSVKQKYPSVLMRLRYPGRGNFFAVVGDSQMGDHVALLGRLIARTGLRVETLAAPRFVSGVDFSDHWSYRQNNFPAVMVTDTAFFRNTNYHRKGDLPHTLNCEAMSRLTNALVSAVLEL